MFPAFEIFGKQIGLYGVMSVLGFVACFLVGSRLIRRYDIDIYDFALTMIAAVIGMAVGASVLYAATNYRVLFYGFSHFSEIGWDGLWRCISAAFGGFVFYGGFIGAGIGILIYTKYAKSLKTHRDHLLDIYAGAAVPHLRADRMLFGRLLLRDREQLRLHCPRQYLQPLCQ